MVVMNNSVNVLMPLNTMLRSGQTGQLYITCILQQWQKYIGIRSVVLCGPYVDSAIAWALSACQSRKHSTGVVFPTSEHRFSFLYLNSQAMLCQLAYWKSEMFSFLIDEISSLFFFFSTVNIRNRLSLVKLKILIIFIYGLAEMF